jgi:outer membrane protein assembly factor BamD
MSQSTPFRLFAMLLALVVVLAGCSAKNRSDAAEVLPVDELYKVASTSLAAGNYERASKLLTRLVARFPYGQYTEQAQIDLAYAQYKNEKPEEALSTANRFIKLYPTHARIDYAYYLRGLINFDRQSGLLEKYIRTDSTQRDLQYSRQAFQDFGELLKKYPNSSYAPDARQRMVYLRNTMAQAELNVAKYYLRRDAYVAAQERAKYILENYQETPQAGDALAVLALSYSKLGQKQLADDTVRVLKLNYPDHPYLNGGRWPRRGNLFWQLVPLFGEERAHG